MSRRGTAARDYVVAVDMTPMIDVVFNLLVFFLITLHPIEIVGIHEVCRPQAPRDVSVKPPPMLCVSVHQDGRFMLNQSWVDLSTLGQNLRLASDRDKTQTVMINCSENSGHGSLVAVLDLCARAGLTDVSVTTMPATAGT